MSGERLKYSLGSSQLLRNEDWTVAARITPDGWEVEMATPLRTFLYYWRRIGLDQNNEEVPLDAGDVASLGPRALTNRRR